MHFTISVLWPSLEQPCKQIRIVIPILPIFLRPASEFMTEVIFELGPSWFAAQPLSNYAAPVLEFLGIHKLADDASWGSGAKLCTWGWGSDSYKWLSPSLFHSLILQGPGPGCYSLPPTVGFVSHDYTRFTSPASSFHQRLNNASTFLRTLNGTHTEAAALRIGFLSLWMLPSSSLLGNCTRQFQFCCAFNMP